MVIDTHVLFWLFYRPERLTKTANDSLSRASSASICAVSIYEMTYMMRLGKWPEMKLFIDDYVELLNRAGIAVAPVDDQVCHLAGQLDWPHRDPFDRLIAATAIRLGAPLITADRTFGTLTDPCLRLIW